MKLNNRILVTFGINGSLRKREVQAQASYTEYYLFNSAANLKAYSSSGWNFAYYGYDAANARTYKLSMLNLNQWVNGQPQPLQLQLQNAMFYPNAYLTFNSSGNYTKHYYNGTERICSRLGDRTFSLDCSASLTPQTQQRLGTRIMQVDQNFRAELLELVEAGDVPVEFPNVLNLITLLPAGSNSNPNPNSNPHTNANTSNDIFYYHTNHLGSTAFVTDNNATVTQGFLYAPFGEITTEYTPLWQNGIMPKYSFNAKELDEETGMYYYEARYYKPPVFTSRDPHFERYPTFSPYIYCNNNPIKYIDPTGKDGILIIFPNYMVDTETRLGKQPLGHAGVLLINNKTGLTKYYEYGRYPTTDGTKGRVRNVKVPNVVIDKATGKPTQESLNKVLAVISKQSGQGGKIQGAYVEGDFKTMNDYAQTKYNESNAGNKDYDKNRKSYSLLTNNCGTFAKDVLNQDQNVKKKSPLIFNPTPTNIGEEFRDNFPKIDYDPITNTTSGDIYN